MTTGGRGGGGGGGGGRGRGAPGSAGPFVVRALSARGSSEGLRYAQVSKEAYNRPKETYVHGKRGLSAIAYLRSA